MKDSSNSKLTRPCGQIPHVDGFGPFWFKSCYLTSQYFNIVRIGAHNLYSKWSRTDSFQNLSTRPNIDISRRRFMKGIGVPLGAMTLMPWLNLSAARARGPWISLFNGKDLTGWNGVNGTSTHWKVENGLLANTGRKKGNASWIAHERVFDDFELEVEFRFEAGCNSGVFFRTPLVQKSPAYLGNEIQIADMSDSDLQEKLTPDRHMGALYTVASPTVDAAKKPGQWHRMKVRCVGPRCCVSINNQVVQDVDLTKYSDEIKESHPGLLRKDGHIGLQSKEVPIEFRSVRIREVQ